MKQRNLKALLLIIALSAAFLSALSIDYASAAGYNTDVGHYLWSQGYTRTIYACNCPSPSDSSHGFCVCYGKFNPNAAIGAGQDSALNGARYGIVPFSGADSPSRGRIKGENWTSGNLYALLRDLIRAPSNPLNLPPGYGEPTLADAFDCGYVTDDGNGPVADRLQAIRAKLMAQGGLAKGGPTVPVCPACPTCAVCPTPPPPITRPLPVCLCVPALQLYFEPSVASTGRINVTVFATVGGKCPPCPG